MKYSHFIEDLEIIEDIFVQEEGDFEYLLQKIDLSEDEFEKLKSGEVEPDKIQLENIYNFAYSKNLFLNEITWQENIDMFNQGNISPVTHGARKELQGDINLTANIEANNDFSYGFYLGEDISQAGMWVSEEPDSSLYIFTIDKTDLVEATFNVDVEWMLAVSYFRHKIDDYADHPMIKAIADKVDKCDYVYAPIADNKLFEVIDAFTDGLITDLQCLYAISATMLGYQYVIKTDKALSHIEQKEHLYLSAVEKSMFAKEGDVESNTSMNKALIAKKRYANQGKYIDELLGNGVDD